MTERLPFISDKTTNQRKFSATAHATDKNGTVWAIPFYQKEQGMRVVGDRIITDYGDFSTEQQVLDRHLFYGRYGFDEQGNYR